MQSFLLDHKYLNFFKTYVHGMAYDEESLKAELQKANRDLVHRRYEEAIVAFKAIALQAQPKGIETATNSSQNVESLSTVATSKVVIEALKNLAIAYYEQADYIESVRYGEQAYAMVCRLDATEKDLVGNGEATLALNADVKVRAKTRAFIKLCLVKSYFTLPPTRERYDRMGALLNDGHDDDDHGAMVQYMTAVDFRLEQRDRDVMVEHASHPAQQHKKCLRFYFKPRDLPDSRPWIKRTEHSALSGASSHSLRSATEYNQLKKSLEQMQLHHSYASCSILLYRVCDSFGLFQLLHSFKDIQPTGIEEGKLAPIRYVRHGMDASSLS